MRFRHPTAISFCHACVAKGILTPDPNLLQSAAQPAEYMAGGSLKSALGRKADIVAGALTRAVLALDAAKGLEYLHSKVRRGGQHGVCIDCAEICSCLLWHDLRHVLCSFSRSRPNCLPPHPHLPSTHPSTLSPAHGEWCACCSVLD